MNFFSRIFPFLLRSPSCGRRWRRCRCQRQRRCLAWPLAFMGFLSVCKRFLHIFIFLAVFGAFRRARVAQNFSVNNIFALNLSSLCSVCSVLCILCSVLCFLCVLILCVAVSAVVCIYLHLIPPSNFSSSPASAETPRCRYISYTLGYTQFYFLHFTSFVSFVRFIYLLCVLFRSFFNLSVANLSMQMSSQCVCGCLCVLGMSSN